MPSASVVRLQIESALAKTIPSALTPVRRIIRPVVSTGINAIDELLNGGLPLGAITEIVGSECSGRTSLALSFVAQITSESKVCAWIDASNAFHPESAAAAGMDLARLLWVRCGARSTGDLQPVRQNCFALPEKYLAPPPAKRGLHGGGFGPHPRTEVKGVSEALGGLLRAGEAIVPRCMEPQRRVRPVREIFEPIPFRSSMQSKTSISNKPLSRVEQALRATDLLLHGGGFSAIVLDLGSIAPEYALRVPQATWFRYRAAADRAQACILVLTQHPCSKSSAGLVLRLLPGDALHDEATVFTGIQHRVEIMRQRFSQAPSKIVPLR